MSTFISLPNQRGNIRYLQMPRCWHVRCSRLATSNCSQAVTKLEAKVKQNLNQLRSSRWMIAVGFAALTAVGCAGGPLTTREKGAGIGAVGGAAAGGLIGAAAGRPGLGAAIGGGVGLGAGALVGDYMQGQDEAQYQYNQQQIQQNQRVIEQNRTQRQRQEY
jgi:hypothetical protein